MATPASQPATAIACQNNWKSADEAHVDGALHVKVLQQLLPLALRIGQLRKQALKLCHTCLQDRLCGCLAISGQARLSPCLRADGSGGRELLQNMIIRSLSGTFLSDNLTLAAAPGKHGQQAAWSD